MSEATETSPLLVPEIEASTTAEEAGGTPEGLLARDYFQRTTTILTKIILIVAIISIVCIIASAILLRVAPFTSRYWRLREEMTYLGFILAFATVLAIINRRFRFEIGLNIIADFFLAWNIFAWSFGICVDSWPAGYLCDDYWNLLPDRQWENSAPRPGCDGAVLALQILVGISVGLGVIVALSHSILFALRCIACFRARVWTRPSGFRFPSGEVTVSVTVKVLRQQPSAGVTEGIMASDPAVQVTMS